MKTWTVNNGYKISRVLSGFSNSYLIEIDEISILVDTGRASSYKSLLKNMERTKSSKNKLTFLILTHTHYDHCQSAKQIKLGNNCQIIVSRKAIDSISNGYAKIPNGTILITKLISKYGQSLGKRLTRYESFEYDILIDNDHNFQVDTLNINIIETPGHSSDSICIIVNDEIAIVGDAMFGVFKKSVFPPYCDDIPEMIRSWNKLLNTNCKLFLPGHGNEISRGLLEKQYEKYRTKYDVLQ
jgi:hydroxyacylglutathione hydrolase